MCSWSADELVAISIKRVNGGCGIGTGNQLGLCIFLDIYTHCTGWMDGTNALPRDGYQICQHMPRSEVQKFVGAQ